MKVSEKDSVKKCFVISPIGKEGTDNYQKFRDVLDFIFKPAVEKNSIGFDVIRADDLNRTGSFVKDILENIALSYLVIVDMTNQNPNVFYELGIRHTISNRTILVAQSIDDIPSDLREYRTIIYDTTAKGAALFATKISEIILDIDNDPDRPDNPVQTYLPNSVKQKITEYEIVIEKLKNELENCLKGKTKIADNSDKSQVPLSKRLGRIFELRNAKIQDDPFTYSATFTQSKKSGEKITYEIPKEQGSFKLYYVMEKDNIVNFWYITQIRKISEIPEQFSDMRILLEKCSKGQPLNASIIIASNDDFKDEYENIKSKYEKLLNFLPAKEKTKFELLLWDNNGLNALERELGIVID